jgi:hypothetical protein
MLLLVTTAASLSWACDDSQIKNLTGDFVEFHEASQALPDSAKLELFKSTLFTRDSAVYKHVFEDWESIGWNPNEQFLRNFDRFAEYRDRYETMSETVSEQLDSSLSTFRERFPDFDFNFEVHLIHSLGLADGTRRTIGDKSVFIVGLDVIARFHDWDDNTAFFHHELTHFYLHQFYEATNEGELHPDGLYNQLWNEGVATHVSHALNPDATYRELMLEIPSSLPEAVDPILGQIAAQLLEDLYATEWEVKSKYFAMRSEHPLIPRRAGYYLGYLLVKQIAESDGLDALFPMKDTEFVPRMVEMLEVMRAQG